MTGGVAGRWPAIRSWIGLAARLGLAGTWFWAGVSKIGDPAASVRAVRAYRVLPEWLAKGVGYGLPFLEIALAVLLLVGLAGRLAAILSAALLVVFTAGMVAAWVRGLRIECGCFGGGGDLTAGARTHYPVEVLRDIGLLALAAFGLRWPRTPLSADDAVRRSVPTAADVRAGARTKAAQRRLAELQARYEQQAAGRLRLVSALSAVALVVVAGTGLGVQAHRARVAAGPAPQAVTVDSGVLIGKPTAKVTIEMYEDMQCPACKQFEAAVRPVLDKAIEDGTVQVHYYVIAFLNGQSVNFYSTRGANAAYCAADAGVFKPYHDLLYENQPAERTAGPENDALAAQGAKVGATSPAFTSCVRTGKYASFVDKITDQANIDGVSSTPTVLVNRTQLLDLTGSGLQAAITAALGG
jgi:protein-disulfide isomerase/uncharacterized membrane protein YphA (DoxX/SURF4 family)